MKRLCHNTLTLLPDIWLSWTGHLNFILASIQEELFTEAGTHNGNGNLEESNPIPSPQALLGKIND